MNVFFLIAAVIVGTWNGNWFPSGRAEHRAHPAVEAATTAAAGAMLAEGLKAIDPQGTNDIILCFNEIRGPQAASNLIAAIGRTDLKLASVSGYRRRDRFDQQQDVIATTLPVAEARWGGWRRTGEYRAPRGYAFAAVVLSPAVTAAVYAVHLKSNYGATTPKAALANREKRAAAIGELLMLEAERTRPVVIAGDLNADKWRREFAEERIFNLLESAAFANLLELLPPNRRGTHPSRRYGDSALDYVFIRELKAVETPKIIANDSLSDHNALFAVVDIIETK